MRKSVTNWGIIGTGHAQEFAKALQAVPGACVFAVVSRSQARAQEFATQYDIPHAYHDVEAFARNPEMDVVYIGSSPDQHAAHALICLGQGKAVVVEKPFTIDSVQAEAVYGLARQRGLFCMEALWSRFLPATRQVAAWLAEGQIGTVRQVIADFGFAADWDPQSRYFSRERCGGALLDVGVYSLAFAALALGAEPSEVAAQTTICATGVDEQTSMLLKYRDGALALLSCANRTALPHRGTIIGTLGRIDVEGFVWAHGAILHRHGQTPHIREPKLPLPAYSYEAIEAMRCLALGLQESPLLPASEVLARMRCMDAIRAQIGVTYPGSARAAAVS
jgi:predicted dehydrogenase